eukprot:XP_011442307.1 PREDICTED: uncharacterized protein LOC105338748 isoform X2 [Crassostrea gigas]
MYQVVESKNPRRDFLSKNLVLELESLSMTKGHRSHNCLDRKPIKLRTQLQMEQEKELPQNIIRRVLDTLKGQSVVARRDSDGLYYPGTVVKCPDPRHALVEFEDKEQVLTPTRLMIATSGAIARPHLRVGDCVLVRVVNSDTKLECYAPGIVQVLPQDETVQAKFYTVMMYNGQQATVMRNYIMKISKSRFEFAIRYIADIQMQSQGSFDENVYVKTPRSARPSDKEKRGRREHRDRERKASPSPEVEISVVDQSESNPPTDQNSVCSDRPASARPPAPTPNTARSGKVMSPLPEEEGARSPTPTPRAQQSNSRSRSRSDSRSRSRSRSRSHSRSKSRSRSRSNSGERSKISRSNSRSSRSRSRSRSSGSSRSQSPVNLRTRSDSMERLHKKSKKMKQLKKQLKHQQDEFEAQQQKIQKQAKKLKKLKKKLKKRKKYEKSVKSNTAVIAVEDSDDSDDSKMKLRPETPSSVQAPEVTSGLLKLRKSLPCLREGEEVMARWSDEGWYFRGVVKQDCNDFSYIIEDSTRMCERIWREDIITDYDDANQIIQPNDPVVALHPDYSFSYAPGIVLKVYQNLEMKIRFYDGQVLEEKLPREEIYKLTQEKYEHDVNYIVQCETRWVGQAVVARDDRMGSYHLASVKERVGNGREYMLEWCDGEQSTQTSHHIFGVFTKHHPLSVGDHVLAMWDSNQHVYLPGWVAGIVGEKINIRFCDGTIRDVDDILQCFWLSSDYYENAVIFYNKCQTLRDDSA